MIPRAKKPKQNKLIYDSWMNEEVFFKISAIINHKQNGKKLPLQMRMAELADFLYRAVCIVIARTNNTDFADPSQFINTRNCPVVEFECEECGHTNTIDMVKLAKDMAKAEKEADGHYKSNHERVVDDIRARTKEWNSTSTKKVPYEFIKWLEERI